MLFFWNDYLYQPLFNFLIWIYNNWTDQNLGWAVVYLTLILRIFLLPFTLITERNQVRDEELYTDIKRVEKAYQKDPIVKKEEIRKILKKRRVQPWAKVVALGVQLLVLVLLYNVFYRGITGEKLLRILYPSVDFPGVINTVFYGFELGATQTYVWPGIVTVFLLGEVYFGLNKRASKLTKGDLTYFILFPLMVFLMLWWLPMVKSLFIFISILFSAVVSWMSRPFFRRRLAPAAGH